jgi:isopenicillin-N epimerase
LAYPAVRKAARYVAERAGARLVEVPLPLPVGDDTAIIEAVSARLGNRTRLALFDHIGAAAALKLPVEELIRRAKSAGARVLIDGAHAPGQIALDLPALGADWYVGNLHKWYFAPRACGILWASREAQEGLHPLSISHGYEAGFIEEFDWTGTRDFTAALAAPAGIAFHNRLGGTELMARNAALCREAAAMLARAWRTEMGAPPEAFQAMATVRLPRGGDPRAFVTWLAETHRIETTAAESGGALWLRIAAQAYNEMGDYERLAAAVTKGP